MDVSGKFLADRYGVSTRTITTWATSGLIVRKSKDCYDLESADRYYISKLKDEIVKLSASPESGDPNNPQVRLTLAQCRKTEAEASLKELELDLRKGLLIDFKEVEEDLSEALEAIKAQFTALPGICSVKLSGMDNVREIEGYLTKLVDERLAELALSFDALATEEKAK
jgi:phage terminase Nu1 subunit (DNA packaging protein)